jgi:hypothetical protein
VLNRDKTKQLLILILVAAVLIRIPIALYMGDQITVLPGIPDQVFAELQTALDVASNLDWEIYS